jgi:OOP family OmpA-OmpF porin
VLAALAAAPEGDHDGDGVKNAADTCPLAPGRTAGCPESHRVSLESGVIELLVPLRFEDGSVEQKGKPGPVLDELAATLRANPKMKVALESHAADEPDPSATRELTSKRAGALKAELVKRGVGAERVRALGCGQDRPIAPNNVPWGRKKNDRVELHVLDPAPSGGVHSSSGCVEHGGT